MAIEFTTSRYRMSHGKEPRGEGYWAFEFSWSPEPQFAPGLQTLGQAKVWARAQVAAHYNASVQHTKRADCRIIERIVVLP